jgi:hypothetical protein
MSDRNQRDRRIAEIDEELKPIRERLHELSRERAELVTANEREDWPDGPFSLHYWRHGGKYTDEHDTPLEAVHAARFMEEDGSASTEKITDRHGNVIYEPVGFSAERVADGYPDAPDD